MFRDDVERLIGPRPAGLTFDRIDNDGGYEPGNVRWADRRTQTLNQRSRRPKIRAASRFKGVDRQYTSHAKQVRWRATYRDQYLGKYEDEEAAARAVDRAAFAHRGDKAFLNFPEDLSS